MKLILRLVVSGLFWVLIAFWVIFAYYSIFYFFTGGTSRVVEWYSHLSRMQFQWDWRLFLARLMANLAVTVGLYFLRRRLHAGSEPSE